MLHVGQQVVCIAEPQRAEPAITARPVVGGVYTIREIRTDVKRPQWGVGLLFFELNNPLHRCGLEWGFYSYRFRLVRKTDISVFTAMLTKLPENV